MINCKKEIHLQRNKSISAIEMQTMTLSVQQHHNEQRLFAEFPYNKELNLIMKEIPGARWSSNKKQWHFNLNRQVVELLQKKFSSIAQLDLTLLKKQLMERKQKQNEKKLLFTRLLKTA